MPNEDAVLQIRCSEQTKIQFKVLAASMGENYEETLKRLLQLEKETPLQKKLKGVVERF